MMTAVIRDDLVRQESERRVAGIEGIIDAVNKLVPNSKPEMISKLKMAVEKQIAFSEHGGEVDFVTPITVDVAADDYDAGLADTMAEVRQLIEDVRAEQQKTKLLTFKDDSAGNDD